ncbi:MAG: alpha/beta hydrolase [Bacteroidetes bacterium]|nr:alpha/beta hydrolase [Bacteroidota bacterium]
MEASEITIPIGNNIHLKGNLHVPAGASSFVIFSHGSGSSRFSRRNNHVAEILNKEGIATLLTDLLTEKEDEIYENRFNIDLITERLIVVTNNARQRSGLQNTKIGFFGASTGAASALKAAAQMSNTIEAVVSRGGRPDLAKEALKEVKAPTLLIVGSRDSGVIELNENAFNILRCEKKLEIVNGATHLFEEPGKLDEVARLATNWFVKYLHPVLATK